MSITDYTRDIIIVSEGVSCKYHTFVNQIQIHPPIRDGFLNSFLVCRDGDPPIWDMFDGKASFLGTDFKPQPWVTCDRVKTQKIRVLVILSTVRIHTMVLVQE